MKTSPRRRNFLLAAGSCLLAVSAANAQTWTGGGTDNLWGTSGNWTVAPVNGNSLTFSGTTRQTNTNNTGINSIGTLTLSNGGWDIDLNGTVTMTTINATGSSKLTGNVTFTGGSPRTITLNGTSTTLEITGQLSLSRANNVLDLQVNGSGNTLLVGSLTMGASGGNKTISGTANVTVTGAVTEGMSGTTAFVKNGEGTLTFNGSYTSDSLTTVNGGTMLINGNASAATGTFTVGASGTLGGIGTVGGATTVSGTLRPGQTVGSMTFQNTLALAGSTFMEIDGTAGAGATGGHDFVNLTGIGAAGALTYGGSLTLDIGALFSSGSYTWNLFDFASESQTFSSITLADQYSGTLLDGNTDGVWNLTSGTDTWTFTESTGVLGLTVIPEPSAALLGGIGFLLLLRRRR